VTKVHPIEGTTTEVTFRSEIKGIGRFSSGKNVASVQRLTEFVRSTIKSEKDAKV
jgi:hypothetical protein